MKKLVALLAIVLFAGSTAFAAIHDGTATSTKTGTGTFNCTIIQPLTITSPQAVDLGEFVLSSVATENVYTLTENNTFNFVVNGEPKHNFTYTITEANSDDNATLSITWTGSDATTLVTTGTKALGDVVGTTGLGAYTITAKVNSVTAKKVGSTQFDQTVTVAYAL